MDSDCYSSQDEAESVASDCASYLNDAGRISSDCTSCLNDMMDCSHGLQDDPRYIALFNKFDAIETRVFHLQGILGSTLTSKNPSLS